ncbi:MAG: DegT/DnrJ/EryC1/StrS family aminotransferase [Nitrospirota bacterium]
MMNNVVPFLDLNISHNKMEEEFVSVFQQALRTGRFIGGPMVEDFEREFSQYCDTKHCIGVGSGTDALRFALRAAGVQQGDIVITVPNTFIATTEAITQVGALPVFVDIDEETYNMNVEEVREYLEVECVFNEETGKLIKRNTKSPVTAIVPVHLYGQMADMDPILELAERYKLIIVEDACQAHGAEYFSRKDGQWKKAGSMGTVSAFSFYAGKNLGAFGEGGAVTTNHDNIAHKVKMLRDHGQEKKYIHEIEGYNGRLDAIQAGILGVKLKYLSGWNEQRRERAEKYNELLSDLDEIKVPYEPEWTKTVYHLYVIRVRDRHDLQRYLSENGIATGLHYPVPLHLQKAYSNLGYTKGSFPLSEKAASEILSLPMYPGLSEKQQQRVVEKIKEFRNIGARLKA